MIEKQCQFSGEDRGGIYVHLLHPGYDDNIELVKEAQASLPVIEELQAFLKEMKKPTGKVHALVSALGAGEFWGSNTNGDFFPEHSLIHTPKNWNDLPISLQRQFGAKWEWGYPTFYNAHAFQHHLNKNPNRAFGNVIHAAWDDPMKRVLLVVEIDRGKATEMGATGVVDKIENGSFPDVSMGCLPKYAKILRKDGTFAQIADISEGDEVISHRGVPKAVTSTMVRLHKGEIYYVKAYGHRDPIVLTEEHPMWVVRKSHMECHPSSSSVNRGRKQRVCTPESRSTKIGCSECETKFAGRFEWLRADEVEVGDYLALPIPTFIPSRRFTADEARILGYYLAEGHVVMNSAGIPRSVTFSTGLHETDTHEEIRSIAARAGLDDSLSEIDVEERGGKYITINDVDLASLCYDNCSKGSQSKVMSKSLMGADPETLQLFLGAYANGDGGCYKGSIYLSTSSEHLSDQLRIALARIGCIASVNKIIHKPSKWSVVRVETVEYQVWIGTDTAYRFTGSRFTPGRSKRIHNRRFFYEYEGVTYLMSPVESIEVEDYDDEVFNFSVEEDESYLVEGLAVHNCRVPFDLCSICTDWARITGNPKKDLAEHKKESIRGLSVTTHDYCSHLRFETGKIYPDGRKVWMWNLHPRFFDISFVFVGADKSSKVLAKLAAGKCPVRVDSPLCPRGCTQCNDHGVIKSAHVHDVWSRDMRKAAAKMEKESEIGAFPEYEDDIGGDDPKTERSLNAYFAKKRKQAGGGAASKKKEASDDLGLLAEAFGIEKTAELSFEKQAEIIKRIQSHFNKALPEIEERERDIPDDTLDEMSKCPSDSLSTAGGLGIVLKPREFQKVYLGSCGMKPLADDLDDRGMCFRAGDAPPDPLFRLSHEIIPKLLSVLKPLIADRSALGPPLKKRVLRITIIGKPRPEAVTPDHPLMDKVASAYQAYRQQLVYGATDLIKRAFHTDPQVLEAVTGDLFQNSGPGIVKSAGDVVQSVLGMFPSTYLNRVYLPGPVSGYVEDHANYAGMREAGALAASGGVV